MPAQVLHAHFLGPAGLGSSGTVAKDSRSQGKCGCSRLGTRPSCPGSPDERAGWWWEVGRMAEATPSCAGPEVSSPLALQEAQGWPAYSRPCRQELLLS